MILGLRAHDYGTRQAHALFSAIAADGWKTIQLAPKKALEGVHTNCDITPALTQTLQQELAACGLSVAVLGAYIEPSLVNTAERKQQVAIFCEQLPLAKQLNAGCMGTETTNMETQPGVSRKEALLALRHSLAEILPKAEELGVTVAIEPVFSHAMATPEATKAVLQDLRSPNLKVIFDPVNILTPHELATQNALWQRAFDCFGGHIAAVHIKGAKPVQGKLLSCPLDESVVNYAPIFEGLRQTGQNLPILREEAVPAMAKQDLAFMQSF